MINSILYVLSSLSLCLSLYAMEQYYHIRYRTYRLIEKQFNQPPESYSLIDLSRELQQFQKRIALIEEHSGISIAYFIYLSENNLTNLIKYAISSLFTKLKDPYKTLSAFYLYIARHVPHFLQSQFLHYLLKDEYFTTCVEHMIKDIYLYYSNVTNFTLERTLRTIKTYLHTVLPIPIAEFIMHRFSMRYHWHDLNFEQTQFEKAPSVSSIGISLNDTLLCSTNKGLMYSWQPLAVSSLPGPQGYVCFTDRAYCPQFPVDQVEYCDSENKPVLYKQINFLRNNPPVITYEASACIIDATLPPHEKEELFRDCLSKHPIELSSNYEYVFSHDITLLAVATEHIDCHFDYDIKPNFSIINYSPFESQSPSLSSLLLSPSLEIPKISSLFEENILTSQPINQIKEKIVAPFSATRTDTSSEELLAKLKAEQESLKRQQTKASTLGNFSFPFQFKGNSQAIPRVSTQSYIIFKVYTVKNQSPKSLSLGKVSSAYLQKNGLRFSHNNQLLAALVKITQPTGTTDTLHIPLRNLLYHLYLWNIKSSKQIFTYMLTKADGLVPLQLSFSHDDAFLLVGNAVFNTRTGQHIVTLFSEVPNFVACSYDDSLLAFASENGHIALIKRGSIDELFIKKALTNTLTQLKKSNSHPRFTNHVTTALALLLTKNKNSKKQAAVPVAPQYYLENSDKRLTNDYVYRSYSGLSLDSGSYGILPAVIMQVIEEKCQAPIYTLFDCIGGSGFGGIAALAITTTQDNRTPYTTLDAIIKFFDANKRAILLPSGTHHYRYKSHGLHATMRTFFGTLCLSDTLTQVIIPAYTAYNTQKFRFDSTQALRSPYDDFFLSDVAQVACADNCYFAPYTLRNLNKTQKITVISEPVPYSPAQEVLNTLIEKQRKDRGELTTSEDAFRKISLLSVASLVNKQAFDFSDLRKKAALHTTHTLLTKQLSVDGSKQYMRIEAPKALLKDNNFFDESLVDIQTIVHQLFEDSAYENNLRNLLKRKDLNHPLEIPS